jgi:hypothetical protein
MLKPGLALICQKPPVKHHFCPLPFYSPLSANFNLWRAMAGKGGLRDTTERCAIHRSRIAPRGHCSQIAEDEWKPRNSREASSC